MPAKAAKVPITAPVTTPEPNWASKNLLRAPSATPSTAANAMTRAGLMTRLNELTSDRPKAVSEPTVIRAIACW